MQENIPIHEIYIETNLMQIHEYTIHENFKNCKALMQNATIQNATVQKSHSAERHYTERSYCRNGNKPIVLSSRIKLALCNH